MRGHVIDADVGIASCGQQFLVLADLELVDLTVRMRNGAPADASGGLPESNSVVIASSCQHQGHAVRAAFGALLTAVRPLCSFSAACDPGHSATVTSKVSKARPCYASVVAAPEAIYRYQRYASAGGLRYSFRTNAGRWSP